MFLYFFQQLIDVAVSAHYCSFNNSESARMQNASLLPAFKSQVTCASCAFPCPVFFQQGSTISRYVRPWATECMNAAPTPDRARLASPAAHLPTHIAKASPSTRPDFLQLSQFHPAWFENWKWNATISFFFLPRSVRVASGAVSRLHVLVIPDLVRLMLSGVGVHPVNG